MIRGRCAVSDAPNVSTRPQAVTRGNVPVVSFTEHGAIQAATILNSPHAVEMSVYVVRVFVKLRELLASNKELARRLDELEARIEKKLTTHDQAIGAILSAIRQLTNAPTPKRRHQYQFVFALDAGHCEPKVRDQTLPEALQWVWRGYEPARHHGPGS